MQVMYLMIDKSRCVLRKFLVFTPIAKYAKAAHTISFVMRKNFESYFLLLDRILIINYIKT